MKKLSMIVAAAALALPFAQPAFAEGGSDWTGSIIMMHDHAVAAASLLGAPVYNDQSQKIGTLQDVLIKAAKEEPTAILSVGDFLAHGPKLVAVPLSHVKVEGNRMVMSGATKQMLMALPSWFASVNNSG